MVSPKANKPFIVGIAGSSGSGKTLFLNCFLNHFTTDQICLLSQDNYYKPKEFQPIDENGQINFDLPQCIDEKHLLSDLDALIAGRQVVKKEYTFNVAENEARNLVIKSAPIILVEGIFIFHFKEISRLFDLKVFIDAEEEIALNRRLKRDMAERGYSHEMILYQWKNHVLPAYKKFLLPYKNSADKLFANNTQVTHEIIKLSQDLSEELKKLVFPG
ncbi:MAG TPA: uridine kinase [Pedobacter sp.]|jgi:uridine kinase